MSWNDADAYARWLGQRSGHHYRLPTAAEARALPATGGAKPVAQWLGECSDGCRKRMAAGSSWRGGGFYGAANDALIEPVRKRQFPIVGDGGGVSSFLHLDDAAAAAVLALEHSGPAIYNIVDDDPAPVRDFLPVLANALGAKPPRHAPTWLARLFAGRAAVEVGTKARGASNAKAKGELGWTPRYPSWRQGFAEVYANPTAVTVRSTRAPARS